MNEFGPQPWIASTKCRAHTDIVQNIIMIRVYEQNLKYKFARWSETTMKYIESVRDIDDR